MTIFPLFIIMVCPTGGARDVFEHLLGVLQVLRLTRLARVMYVIKASTRVLQNAISDIVAVGFTSLIIIICSGSFLYYVEFTAKGTMFTSIPQSMWWAVQTVFCLGYGDVVPITVVGRVAGALLAFFGVTVTTVLILSLGGTLFDTYSKCMGKSGFLPDYEKQDYEIHYKDDCKGYVPSWKKSD